MLKDSVIKQEIQQMGKLDNWPILIDRAERHCFFTMILVILFPSFLEKENEQPKSW